MPADDPDTPATPASEAAPDARRARRERWQMALVCVLLVATGALGWSFSLRPALAVDTAPLASFPDRFGGWRGESIPIEDDVTRLLQADFNLQRAYVRPIDELVWLYVGYYGTDRGGHTEHTPWVCYPSAGWEIERSASVVGPGGGDRRANELVVSREGQRRLVHFWYRSFRATGLTSEAGWMLDRMLGRLLDGRADGALVRVSTPIDERAGGVEQARAMLVAFGAEVEALLESHWPEEGERSAARPAPRRYSSPPGGAGRARWL